MKQKLFILLFTAFAFLATAQIKGVVVDENDKTVPYVNILAEDGSAGTTADVNGQFEIAVSNQNKTFVFSGVGYETQKTKLPLSRKVVLKFTTIQLSEVRIEKPLATIETEMDKFDKDKVHFYYGLAPNQYFLGKFFTFNDTIQKTPFLKSISLSTNSKKNNTMIKIRLMSAGEDGSPETDLINENLIFKVRKGNKKSEFDVSKYKLKIDEQGLFVVVEFLMVKENEYYMNGVDGKKETHYSPWIGALPCEEKNLWIYNKNWRKTEKRNPYNYPDQREYFNKYIELAMSVKLTN